MMESSQSNPRVGIVGAGALGTYFGIRLANSGNPVSFLLRSDYPAIREQACLQLTRADGSEVIITDPDITRNIADLRSADWLIIGLKTTFNSELATFIAPAVTPDTVLITLQNGLGNVELLHQAFPNNPIIGVLCQIGVNRIAPGQIRSFVPKDGSVLIGAGPNASSALLEAVLTVFETAGLHCRRTQSLEEAIWRKLMWNVPFNGLTVAAGAVGTDVICNNPHLRSVAIALMHEIRAAAMAQSIAIEAAYVDQLMQFTDKMGHYMASSVLDWLAKRPLEIDAIWLNPLQAGQRHGVAMPHLATLCAILHGLNERH